MDLTQLPVLAPYIVTALLGLCIGSFLNVCIVRIPRGTSIVSPGSHCPRCKTAVRWYDNLPVLSYCWLGGCCRCCRAAIGPRYMLVELLTAALAVLTWQYFPTPLAWGIWFVLFIAPLIAMTFIDLEHQILPDVFTLPGIVCGLLAQIALAPDGQRLAHLAQGVLGVLVGGGMLWLVGYAYWKLRKQEGLGGGDVKLAAMFGAFLGWKAVIVILLGSSLLGSIVGIVAILVLRKGLTYAIPYGPFLATAAIGYLFWGTPLVEWYLGLFVG